MHMQMLALRIVSVLLVTTIGLPFASFAQLDTLFWVGGLGDWSDLTHWATTSGGSVHPITLPDSQTTVVFDGNSFQSPAQSVFVDVPMAYCRDMDWSQASLYPIFTLNYHLQIHGSLRLSPNMTFWTEHPVGIPVLEFAGNSPGHVIDFAGNRIGGGASGVAMWVQITGAGGFELLDSVMVGTSLFGASRFEQFNGTLNTNGHPVTASTIRINTSANPNATTHLGNSKLTCIDSDFDFQPTNFESDSASLTTMRLQTSQNLHLSSLELTNFGSSQFSSVQSPSTDTVVTLDFSATANGATTLGRLHVRHHFQVSPSLPSLQFDYLQLDGSISFPADPLFPLTLGGYPLPNANILHRNNDSICLEHIRVGSIQATGTSIWTFNSTCTDLGGNSGNLSFGNCNTPTSTTDLPTPSQTWMIYPNPVKSGETLTLTHNGLPYNGPIQIHDIMGRTMASQPRQNQGKWEMPNLPTGAYLLGISQNGKWFFQNLWICP